MENYKLYQLITFAFCSAVNDNLNYIYHIGTIYNKKLDNINNSKSIKKINRCIKEISKELFK